MVLKPQLNIVRQLRVVGLVMVWLCALAGTLYAERFPLSPAGLARESELILVGRILALTVGVERSHIETGFGNYDWAIDLTLRIQRIEKGQYDQSDTIVVRCFRIKSRKSVVEYLTVSGNHPIPGAGEEVRAHLYRRGGVWRVVFPNGVGPVTGQAPLADASAVPVRGGGTYTYWLPLELWICIAGAGMIFIVIRSLIRRFRRLHSPG